MIGTTGHQTWGARIRGTSSVAVFDYEHEHEHRCAEHKHVSIVPAKSAHTEYFSALPEGHSANQVDSPRTCHQISLN